MTLSAALFGTAFANMEAPLHSLAMDALTAAAAKMFPENSIHFESPGGGRTYLLLGTQRNTKQDPGQWVDENGNARDWDYISKSCIAAGNSPKELLHGTSHHTPAISMEEAEQTFHETMTASIKGTPSV